MKVDWVPIKSVFEQPRQEWVTVDAGVMYPNIGLQNHGRGLFWKQPLDGSVSRAPRLNRLSEGDLVYSKLFAWEGSVGVVGSTFSGAYVSSEFPAFVADQRVADVRYLAHVVCSSDFEAQLKLAASGLGQRRRRVNPGPFQEIQIPLPSLADQRRIAHHLDAVIAAQARVAGPRRSLDLAGVTESLLDMIWESCPTIALSSILTPSTDVVDVADDEVYSMVGVKSHGRGAFHSGPLSGASTRYTRLRRLTHGQVIYPKLMAWGGAFDVLGSEFEGDYVSPEFVTFDLRRDDVSLAYLRALLQSERWRRIAEDASRGTNVNRRRLHPDDFLALEVPLPTSDQVLKINRVLALARNSDEASRKVVEVGSMLISAARNEVFSQLTR